MAFFIATGTISNDIVRKETRNGVLTTFRLETGAPRDRKLWIDIECWGHLAGTIAHHGTPGRSVSVSGRLTHKTWRDTASGEARQRIIVTANDVDLISGDPNVLLVPNSVVLRGTVETILPSRPTRTGLVSACRVADGRAGSKTGRLVLDVEHWSPDTTEPVPQPGATIAATGGLCFGAGRELGATRLVLDARTLEAV